MLYTSNVAPADVFHGNIFPCHKLRTFNVWVCPVLVIDPKISNGQKLPIWKPKSRRGVFLGYSPNHSSDVPLFPNLTTGNIYPQYHMVFDYTLRTVQSISDYEYPPVLWNDAAIKIFTNQFLLEYVHSPVFHDEWLTPAEQEDTCIFIQRKDHIYASYQPSQTSFHLEEPLQYMPPSVPISTTTTTILQY